MQQFMIWNESIFLKGNYKNTRSFQKYHQNEYELQKCFWETQFLSDIGFKYSTRHLLLGILKDIKRENEIPQSYSPIEKVSATILADEIYFAVLL